MRTENETLHYHDGFFYTVSVPQGTWQDVDEFGRLLVNTSEGLKRISTKRTVSVAGLVQNAALEGVKTLTFLSTDQENTESIHAWIDQTPLSLTADFKSTIDANDYD